MPRGTLSVLMANYNHARYIGDALSAILQQSYRPAEVLVVDDASTDDSVAVIERFARRNPIVRLLRNDRNRGAIFSANRALKEASGEYIYSASADDCVLPGLFEKSLGFLAREPRAGLCCSEFSSFGDDGIIHTNRQACFAGPVYLSPLDLADSFRNRNFSIPGNTAIVRWTDFLEADGLIPSLHWYCDWFALLVVGFRRGVCYIPEPLAAFRRSPNSYSASSLRQGRDRRAAVDQIFQLIKTPAYRDVAGLFRRSAAARIFGLDALSVIMSNPADWNQLSLRLVRGALAVEAKRLGGRVIPPAVRRIYQGMRQQAVQPGASGGATGCGH